MCWTQRLLHWQTPPWAVEELGLQELGLQELGLQELGLWEQLQACAAASLGFPTSCCRRF